MGLLGDARCPRRKKADRAGHWNKRRDPEISLWDPSRPAAALCLSPAPRAVQYRLHCWWRRQVPSMGRRGAGEGPLWRGWLGGVERQKTSKLSEKALNLPSYLGGQIDLIMSSFMGLKTGMIWLCSIGSPQLTGHISLKFQSELMLHTLCLILGGHYRVVK